MKQYEFYVCQDTGMGSGRDFNDSIEYRFFWVGENEEAPGLAMPSGAVMKDGVLIEERRGYLKEYHEQRTHL